MSYFLRTTSETQKRLNAVINKRKEDEEELRPVSPVGGAGDSVNINAPTDFSASLPGAESVLSGEQTIRPTYANQYRRFATREWIVPPGIITPDHPGVPRPTDAQVAQEAAMRGDPGEAARIESGQPRSQATLYRPPLDMRQLQITDPFAYQELAEGLGLATADEEAGEPSKLLASGERYGELRVIEGGNIAGNNPDLLTAGAHQTPVGQVPIIPGHPNTVVLTPEEADSAVLVEQLVNNSPVGTVARVEGESQFGTLSTSEAFKGMGEVMLGFMDVAATPFEVAAETAFQMTHTLPQNTTLFQEGFGATVERHRARGLISQLAIGVVFDPFVLGKVLKVAAGVTRAAASRHITRVLADTPNLSDAQRAAVHDEVLDKVVDRSGYTIDSDMRRWWSPAQQAWVDVSDQAAHVREFGAPLIAGGAPIPGEREFSPFPGGRFLRMSPTARGLEPIKAGNVLRKIEELGITDEELLQIQNNAPNNRVTINLLEAHARARDSEIAANVISRTDEEAVARNTIVDADAAVSGMGDSYSNYWDPALPDPRTPGASVSLTPTVVMNPNVPGGAAEAARLSRMPVAERAREMHSSREVAKPGLKQRVSEFQLKFQEALVDRTARTNALQDRVAADILVESNVWRVKNGFEPLYRLPDGMRSNIAFALSMGVPAAAEDASRLSLSRIFKKLDNKFIDRAGDNIDTIVLNDYVSMMHHLDVIRVMRRRDAQAGVLGDPVRVGMNQMTDFEMREYIAAIKREYTPEGWDDQIGAWRRAEVAKESAAMQAGEAYTRSKQPMSRWDRLTAAAEELFEHYRGLREYMVSEGMLSRELSDELARDYPHYNPIRYIPGVIIPLQQTAVTRSKNRALLGMTNDDVLKELTERGLDAEHSMPFLEIERATADVYRKAAENRFTSTLIELARNDKTLPAGTVKQVVTLAENQSLGDLLPYQLSSRNDVRPGMRRVARLVNGEQEIWEIPGELAEQLDLLQPISPNLGERIARMINKPMRMAFTSHNPVFMAANFLHDMMVVIMNEGVLPHEVLTSLAATFTDVWKRDNTLHALIQAGGDVGGLSGKLADDIRARTMREPKFGDAMFKSHADWLTYIRKIGEPLNYLSRAIEMAPRRAVFKKALQREEALRQSGMGARRQFTVKQQPIGQSDYVANVFDPRDLDTGAKVTIGGRGLWQETSLKAFGRVFDEPRQYSQESVRAAAYAARNATVDFQKYGSAIKMFDALFLYTNAAIQGTLLPIRAFRRGGPITRMGAAPGVGAFAKTPGRMGGIAQRAGENKAKLGSLGFMGVALTVYAHNMLRYPEAFQNMSLQDKVTRFALIHGEEEDEYGNKVAQTWSLQPLLREYAVLNSSVVMMMDKLVERDSATATQFLTTLVPNINPAGTVVNFGGRDASFGLQSLPTPTTPLQIFNDYHSNWDSFRNAPIVSEELASRPVEEQYDAYTSELAKAFGGLLGLSPKKVDNAMRVGAFKDVVTAIDLGLKKLNPDEPDPEIRQLAAELANELERVPPSDHSVTKNIFFKNMTSEQRRQIERIIDAEPTGVPFVTTLQNRFHRESGGQKRRTGVYRATKAYGVSAQETSDMAQLLGSYMDQLHDEQLLNDQLYKDGRIAASQWIEREREQGVKYAGAVQFAMITHPNAAQAMKDENGVMRDPKKWSDYKVMVATARGWWGDTRTTGQILAAERRGIPMPIDPDGSPDYHAYFKRIEEYEQGILDDPKYGEAGLEQMRRELTSVMTDVEETHYMEVGMGGEKGLRHYWDIAGLVAARTGGPAGHIYRQYLVADPDERLYLKKQYNRYISSVQRVVNRERELYRRRNPDMDALYVKWGYAEAGQTPLGMQALRERIARGEASLAGSR